MLIRPTEPVSLKPLLAIARSTTVSVAPRYRLKLVRKGHKIIAGGLAAAALMRNNNNRKTDNAGLTAPGAAGNLPAEVASVQEAGRLILAKTSSARRTGQASAKLADGIKKLRRLGAPFKLSHQDVAGLPPKITGTHYDTRAKVKARVTGEAASISRRISTRSFAPIKRPDGGGQMGVELGNSAEGLRARLSAERSSSPRRTAAFQEAQISEALTAVLDRQARLPPSGSTGFDPRLSPAWPSLKLPN